MDYVTKSGQGSGSRGGEYAGKSLSRERRLCSRNSPSPWPSPSREREKTGTGRHRDPGLSPLLREREKTGTGRHREPGLFPILGERVREKAFTWGRENKRSPSPRPSPLREREKTGIGRHVPSPGEREKTGTGRYREPGLSPLLRERVRERAFTWGREDKRSPSPRPSPLREREKTGTGRHREPGLSPLLREREKTGTGRYREPGLSPLLRERVRERAFTWGREDKRSPSPRPSPLREREKTDAGRYREPGLSPLLRERVRERGNVCTSNPSLFSRYGAPSPVSLFSLADQHYAQVWVFSKFGRCQRITRHFVARPAGRCWRNALSLRSSRTSLPPEVLVLFFYNAENKKPNLAVGFF